MSAQTTTCPSGAPLAGEAWLAAGRRWQYCAKRELHEIDERGNVIVNQYAPAPARPDGYEQADDRARAAARARSSDRAAVGDDAKRERRSQAELLVALARADATLFHDPAGDSYARVRAAGHRETWPVRSRGFRLWLARRFYDEQQRAANAEAESTALNLLEALARFDGACEPVHLRVAPDGAGGIYLDLADADWRAVHVTPRGWSIVAEPPVAFRRSPGMLALPLPERGGSLDELRALVNVPSDRDWSLVRAWLVAAATDRGPYPVLALRGEQGSAKSTLARFSRGLIDPAEPALRRPPASERDLAIAARACWLVAFDNVSRIEPWLSDALCALATGGGFATRELYTNFDEVLFNARRPVALNGIEEYITRSDLLDRAVQIELPAIPEELRRDERELEASFARLRPRLLGALLDQVAGALRELETLRLDRLPRMADFALLAAAAEKAMTPGWTPGQSVFLTAYARARAEADQVAIDGSAIGPALRKLIETAPSWSGTATELLDRLGELAGETATRQKSWPKSARACSGELRRLAPALRRALGVDVDFDRGHAGRRVIEIRPRSNSENPPAPPSPPSPSSLAYSDAGKSGDGSSTQPSPAAEQPSPGDPPAPRGDGRTPPGDGRTGQPSPGLRYSEADGDGGDGGDGCAGGFSADEPPWPPGDDDGDGYFDDDTYDDFDDCEYAYSVKPPAQPSAVGQLGASAAGPTPPGGDGEPSPRADSRSSGAAGGGSARPALRREREEL